ncbi:hypothetical protein, partial [Thiolapillus sp.]|uniref:hypothetical protein n=1 Tax=Thiolapillus sp. TaxID=2017437 RepID=UPI003AF4F264
CADFLVKSGLIHRCLQFNQAEISGYWHPSGADMPLSGDLGSFLYLSLFKLEFRVSNIVPPYIFG